MGVLLWLDWSQNIILQHWTLKLEILGIAHTQLTIMYFSAPYLKQGKITDLLFYDLIIMSY